MEKKEIPEHLVTNIKGIVYGDEVPNFPGKGKIFFLSKFLEGAGERAITLESFLSSWASLILIFFSFLRNGLRYET